MTSSRNRVAAMIESGQVTPQQGAELLAALDRRGSARTWLLDPFEQLSTGRCLALGAIVAALGTALAMGLAVRFDGALDMHLASSPVPWSVALLDQAVAWPLTAVVMFAAARVARAPARLLDLFAFVGLARAPYLVVALVSWLIFPKLGPDVDLVALQSDWKLMAQLTVGALVTLPLVIYFFVLLVRAYRTATDLRGLRLGISFTAGVLAAEVLSKVALALLG